MTTGIIPGYETLRKADDHRVVLQDNQRRHVEGLPHTGIAHLADMIVNEYGELKPVDEWSIRDRIGYMLGRCDSDRTIDAILSAIPDEALIEKASRCGDPDHKDDCPVCAARRAGIEAYLKELLAQRTPRLPEMWSVF